MTDKITVGWANDEKTIVLCTYLKDGWMWEDAYESLDKQRALIESSDAPIVDVIVDARSSGWMPKGGSLIAGMRKINASRHPRQGQTVFVGAKGILAAMANVLVKLIGAEKREFQFAKTMDEAYALVENLNAVRQRGKS